MIRKTLIAVAAAVTLTLGLGAATAPAEAKVRIYIGAPYYGYHYAHYRPYYRPYYRHPHFYGYVDRAPYHCHIRKVYRHGYAKRVKRCHRAWH
jgi:hypothetical protein